MQLFWQPGFSLSRKPVKKPAARRRRRERFEFVVERPQEAYPTGQRSSKTSFEPSNISSESSNGQTRSSDRPCQGEADNKDETEQIVQLVLAAPNDRLLSSKDPIHTVTTNTAASSVLVRYNGKDRTTPWDLFGATAAEDNVDDLGSDSVAVTVPGDFPSTLDPCIAPTVEHSSMSQRFKPVLDRYNEEFCMIPLTFQLRSNPFRYRTDLDPEPIYLVHAVMALAGHHVNSALTISHRHEALQSLRQSLDRFNDADTLFAVLDTIVVLFSLDETHSIIGNWYTHLMGAYSLIEASGGITALAMSSRLEAQIGILTWWDAIISLLAREDCIFPYAYFEAVSSNQHRREWDFFGLCGCPTDLVKVVMQVAHLNTGERNAPFASGSTVYRLERSLESWCHTPASQAFQDEAFIHQDQDVRHCSEAWRNGLILYMFRVFRWAPGDSVPPSIKVRARAIVDHVVSCRDTNMLSRQALLPLFLAGCELQDRSTRAKIVRICSIWDKRTRYHMFGSTIPLLREVWAEQEINGDENVWWGQIVDK